MIRVLYIHHSGTFGGASRSLLEMIKSFPEDSVEAYLITQKGNTSDYFEKSSIKTFTTKGISQFDNGQYAHYRRWRWFILIREIIYLPFTFYIIYKTKKKLKSLDIIHLNEVQLIFPAIFVYFIFRKPIVIHSRSLQQSDLSSLRTRIIRKILLKISKFVIPIDEAVNASLPPGLNTIVVHNGFNPSTLKVDSIDKNYWDIIPIRKFTVGMVGNLIGHKGFDEFIEAANVLVREGFDINFIVVGDRNIKVNFITKLLRLVGLNHNIRDVIVKKISSYNLSDYFYLFPFTTNLADIYSKFDVLCFPNQTDAIGRPVFEAAYYGKPSIVCLSKILGDTFIDGVTGINIKAKSPNDLVKSIKYLYLNPSEGLRLGHNAQELTQRVHDSKKNSLKILEIYNKIISHDRKI
jgi:glycosyltransferase involved in cell wall biosynthesis